MAASFTAGKLLETAAAEHEPIEQPLHAVAAAEDQPVVAGDAIQGRIDGRPVGRIGNGDARLFHDLVAQGREQFAEFLGLLAGPGDEDETAGQGEDDE